MGKIWDQWKASDWDNEMDLKMQMAQLLVISCAWTIEVGATSDISTIVAI